MNRAISAEVRTVWQSTSSDKKIQYEKLMFQFMKRRAVLLGEAGWLCEPVFCHAWGEDKVIPRRGSNRYSSLVVASSFAASSMKLEAARGRLRSFL